MSASEQSGAYVARSRLALALDLERVLHGLADHLPGEPPAIIAWGPGELAQAIADALTPEHVHRWEALRSSPPSWRCRECRATKRPSASAEAVRDA